MLIKYSFAFFIYRPRSGDAVSQSSEPLLYLDTRRHTLVMFVALYLLTIPVEIMEYIFAS